MSLEPTKDSSLRPSLFGLYHHVERMHAPQQAENRYRVRQATRLSEDRTPPYFPKTLFPSFHLPALHLESKVESAIDWGRTCVVTQATMLVLNHREIPMYGERVLI